MSEPCTAGCYRPSAWTTPARPNCATDQPPAPTDQPTAQAYYVIKAAQEREELQREGDALDAKIRQAEKEVAALEATLNQVGGWAWVCGCVLLSVLGCHMCVKRCVLGFVRQRILTAPPLLLRPSCHLYPHRLCSNNHPAQLMAANGKYGATFKKVDGKAAYEERAALREKLDRVYDKLKFKRQVGS